MQVVQETNFGMYVWETLDGHMVGDDDGNIMNIVAMRGDIQAQKKLQEAARYYGFPDGTAKFLEGVRRVSDEERAQQINRFKEGQVPDELDIGNYRDEVRRPSK